MGVGEADQQSAAARLGEPAPPEPGARAAPAMARRRFRRGAEQQGVGVPEDRAAAGALRRGLREQVRRRCRVPCASGRWAALRSGDARCIGSPSCSASLRARSAQPRASPDRPVTSVDVTRISR
ncbi:hypothetical protein [Streptomyces canus]|uniref:hypothetical protein n=1 Tax=Streptomyces canus TaxID=58343 RepID=UPI0032435BFE